MYDATKKIDYIKEEQRLNKAFCNKEIVELRKLRDSYEEEIQEEEKKEEEDKKKEEEDKKNIGDIILKYINIIGYYLRPF